MPQEPSTPDSRPPKPNPAVSGLVKAERMLQIAVIFPAAVVVGWIAGAALDKWLHQTWIYLAGIILGSVAGFIEVFRVIQDASKNE